MDIGIAGQTLKRMAQPSTSSGSDVARGSNSKINAERSF